MIDIIVATIHIIMMTINIVINVMNNIINSSDANLRSLASDSIWGGT